jgi:four helix bundle protein
MGDGMSRSREQSFFEVNDFTDLRVWQGAMELGERIYRLSWTFPRSETYGLASQMQRAAVSVPSNIAEGHTRASIREYLNFVSIARSSMAELRSQGIFAERIGYLSESQAQAEVESIISLSRQLTALRNALRQKV